MLPAIILIMGKVLGVYLIIFIFGIDFGFASSSDVIFSLTPVVAGEYLQLVSSYSDLIMFILVASGFTYVLSSALYFHDSHIKVSTINMLAKYNLLFLIRSSYQLYHSGIIWLAFTWICDLVVLINVSLGKTYSWILFVTTIFTLALTVILFRDLFKELELQKSKILKGEM